MELNLWSKTGKKLSSWYDNSKHRALIIGKSEKQFKIQSHFGIFDPIIGEGQWYEDAASQALKCVYRLYQNIWLFDSMKSCLDICKSLVDER